MTLNDIGAYRLFKYAVYAFLTINIGLFFHEEWNALGVRFTDGLILGNIMEAFASTIDTTAWVVLLLMFELETYVLDDRQLTRRVQLALQLTRALCYVVIVSAFSGYVAKVMFLAQASPLAAVDGLCELANQGWSFAIDLDEYVPLSNANCGELASSMNLIQFLDLNVVVDQDGYRDLFRLAWVDVINSGTWLLVVALLELDVWLQEHNRLDGAAYSVSNAAKVVLYAILFAAAVYWGFKGDFVDFWDAFLWLVAFVFIERNVIEWRAESLMAPDRSDTVPSA